MLQPSDEVDVGTAYGMKPIEARTHLTQVGPGTPMGELMRRYWQPFYAADALKSDKPKRVRLLGENLIAFRDKQGRPGLVFEHCFHRGTSLFYGRIEQEGIRCCNHGWLFDRQGNCLEQPAEPGGGQALKRYRQPWYPVEERYGLLFAYMGPPEKKPVLPRWEHLENLGPDEYIEARFRAAYGKPDPRYEMEPIDINWLPSIEQSLDGTHLPWLHFHHSGDQFTGVKIVDMKEEDLPPYARIRDLSAAMRVKASSYGVLQGFPMQAPDGTMLLSSNETMVPNNAIIPGFIDMLWMVPADDQHTMNFMLFRRREGDNRADLEEMHDGKFWRDLTDDEHQAMPGDYEAQSSMPAPASTYEHFSTGDRAIVMFRRRLEDAMKDVEEGRDPVGVSFDRDEGPRPIGAFYYRPATEEELRLPVPA